MKHVLTAACLAAACAVGLAAQQQSTTTAQEAQQGQRGPRSVTITGCLRAGDTAGTYILTDVTGLPAMGRRGASDTGTTGSSTAGATETGTSGSAAVGTSAMLMPAADVDLAPHVGHKIEVTGTMGGRNARGSTGTSGTTAGGTTTSGAGTTAGSAAQTTASGQARPMPHVNVSSVRMIAESCS